MCPPTPPTPPASNRKQPSEFYATRTGHQTKSRPVFHHADHSADPRLRIKNGQVLHYTRRDPKSGEISRYAGWLRSVCPWDPNDSDAPWEPIVRVKYSNADLLKSVERVPRMYSC